METKIFIPSPTHNIVYRKGDYSDRQRAATQNGNTGHDWRAKRFSDQEYQILQTQSPKCFIPSTPATKRGHSVATQPLDNANYGREEFKAVATNTDGNFDPRSSTAYGVIRSPRNTKNWLVHQCQASNVNQTSPVGLVPCRSNALAADSPPCYRCQRHHTASHTSRHQKPISADGFHSELSPSHCNLEAHQDVTWRPCFTNAVVETVQFGIDSTRCVRRSEKPTVHCHCQTAESVNMLGISPAESHSSHKHFSFNRARRLSPISVPQTLVTNTVCFQEACYPSTNVSYLNQSSHVRPPSPIFNSDHHNIHHQLVTQKDDVSGIANPHHDPNIEMAHQSKEKCGIQSTTGHGKNMITDRQVIQDQQIRELNSAFIGDCCQPVGYHSYSNDNTSRHKGQGYAVTGNTVSSDSKYTCTIESVSTKGQRLDDTAGPRHLASDSRSQRLIEDDCSSTQPAPQPEMPPVSLAINSNQFLYEKRPFYVSVNAGQELASYVVNLEETLKAGGKKRKKTKGKEKMIAGDSRAVPLTENPSNVFPSNGGVKKDVLSSIRLERVYYSEGRIPPAKATSTTQGQVEYTTSLIPALSEPQHQVVEKDKTEQ